MLYPSLSISIFLLSFLYSQADYRSPSSGWSTQYLSASPAMEIDNSNQISESIVYQASTGRVLISNMNFYSNTTGIIFSTGINGQVVKSSGSSIYNEFPSGAYGTFGLVTDPIDDSLIWAAVGKFPANDTSACAIQSASTTTNSVVDYFDFFTYKNPTLPCLVDDLTVQTSGGSSVVVYATDFNGYRIYKLDIQTGTQSVLNSNTTLLCSGYPSDCTNGATNGPNGITMYTDINGDDWLLIGVSPNRLVKMDPTTGDATIVQPGPNTPPNALNRLDGISLYGYSRDAVLYGAGSNQPNGTVQVMTSTDDWSTYEVRAVFSATCNDESDTAVRLAGDYAIVLCNNNFYPGLSLVNVLSDLSTKNPIAANVEEFSYSYMLPEGFDYDPNRNMLVFGSQSDGGIRGFPYNNLDDNYISYPATSVYTYVAPGIYT
jgi:hypothetical protein